MAISFTPANTSYVNYGSNVALNGTTWFISVWVNRAGTGSTASTGTGGVIAEPLICKCVGEQETPANLNGCYFLGYRSSDSRFVADFEDSAAGTNRPFDTSGTAQTLTAGVWYNIMMLYDLSTFTYSQWFNNAANGTLTLSGALTTAQKTPEVTCVQNLGIGAGLTSGASPTRTGWWNGRMTEAYIWTGYVPTAEDRAKLYGGGSPKKGIGKTISPTNLKVYSNFLDFPNGTTETGANTVKNYATIYQGTPVNSPIGYTDPFDDDTMIFKSTLYSANLY